MDMPKDRKLTAGTLRKMRDPQIKNEAKIIAFNGCAILSATIAADLPLPVFHQLTISVHGPTS